MTQAIPTVSFPMRERFTAVRRATTRLSAPLCPEDCVVQSMPDASPTKWHLAHTTWFFETFVLAKAYPSYEPFDSRYGYLFNSYYEAVGPRHCRPRRGLLSRPTLDEVYAYRAFVDERMVRLLEQRAHDGGEIAALTELGLNHEQQHQELLITDIKHALASNPLEPAYRHQRLHGTSSVPHGWVAGRAGLLSVGHAGPGFAFDNEGPAHQVFLQPHRLGSRLVTSAEFMAFIDDGGYERAELWLSDAWNAVKTLDWSSPLYWRREPDGSWSVFTLAGRRAVDPNEPVCHVSYYEADAYARWAGARLPLESEWEVGARAVPVAGNFLESDRLHPAAADSPSQTGPTQVFGDVWEWTQSPYTPYPGYRAPQGALGEYNGKFMCNQMVLRGGSCATPRSHMRPTYRNFFPPDARWQLTGIRLAADGDAR